MTDEGENVITAELAAGITPEEFAHGPVFHPSMASHTAPAEPQGQAA